MTNEIIKYFRNGLRRKLKRPNCGRFLALWDDTHWKKYPTNININYIKSNDFLVFLSQTKNDLCCIYNNNGQNLCNALDKFFYFMFDFETYFNFFTSNNIYKNRVEIMNDVINFKQFNYTPNRFYNSIQYLELFKDLIKRTDEWNYWKRIVIITFTKIILTDSGYENAQINAQGFLQELIKNIDQIFDKGLNN